MKYWFVALCALGCNEQKFHSIDENYNGNAGAIEVTPLSLSFGSVSASEQEGSVQTFTVTSVGANDIEVSTITIMGDDGASFTLPDDPGSFVLPPGESMDIDVLFLPMGANQQLAQAVVSSNDASEPHIPVNLIGDGIISELEITPDPLNFGSAYVGCSKENEVTLTNVGTESLDVTNLTEDTDVFSIVSTPNMPFTLEPGESEVVGISFSPEVDTEVEGSLSVFSTEPMGERTALQIGSGQYSAMYEQIWENPIDPPSDILFSVDLSCSMSDDAAALGSEFSTFISQLTNYSTDWQIMVANDDDGCNNSGILTPNSSNYQSIFSDAVQSCGNCGWIGEPMNTEALLTTAAAAIDNTDAAECNSNFMRQHSLLHIILVSDEPEQSSGVWSTYVDQIIAKKGNAANVRISAIAGDYPGGCSTSSNSADEGSGYWEAVNYTGGVFMSLCSNWTSPQNLQMLAEASVLLDTYGLDNPAAGSTIVVYVNGSEVTSGWHFDEGMNSVVFDSNPPEEGDHIRIVYSTIAQCD